MTFYFHGSSNKFIDSFLPRRFLPFIYSTNQRRWKRKNYNYVLVYVFYSHIARKCLFFAANFSALKKKITQSVKVEAERRTPPGF